MGIDRKARHRVRDSNLTFTRKLLLELRFNYKESFIFGPHLRLLILK